MSEQELRDFMRGHAERSVTGNGYTALIRVMDAETIAVRIIRDNDVVRWGLFYSYEQAANVLAWAESGGNWKDEEVSE